MGVEQKDNVKAATFRFFF